MNLLPVDLPPLLAIETSTAVCAIGAYVNGETFEDTRYLERAHNQHALGMIDAITASVRHRFGSDFAGFGLVAFGRGPGSFTGVRIGAALAQGIAFAHGAQVLAVASLQVQADALLESSVEDRFSTQPQACIVLVKSRQQFYYAQAFTRTPASYPSSSLSPSQSPSQSPSLSPSQWRALAAPTLLHDHAEWSAWLVGLNLTASNADGEPAPALLGQQPQWLLQDPVSERFVPDVAISAAAVLRVAMADFASGKAVAPELGLPEYLSADSPWQPSA